VSELTNQILEKQVDLDKMKTEMDNEKKQQKLLQDEISAMREMNNDIEKERQSCIALQESHNYLQKSHQHLEREVNRRKEKESELLTFSEKLSSANAELVATKQSLISKLETLEQEMETLKKCCNDQQVTIKDQVRNLVEVLFFNLISCCINIIVVYFDQKHVH
jgi:chromosome segregation ATPase